MDMPKIESCDATRCAYNEDDQCRAPAITVGDRDAARCDTFWSDADSGGDPNGVGQVGACRAADCDHNENLVCRANEVEIGRRGRTVDCLTFTEA